MNKAAKSLPASKLTRFVQEFIYLDSNSATCQRPWLVTSNSQRRNLSHVHPRGIPYFWPCMGCFSRRKSYHGVIITFLKLVICCFPKIRRYFQMVVFFFPEYPLKMGGASPLFFGKPRVFLDSSPSPRWAPVGIPDASNDDPGSAPKKK